MLKALYDYAINNGLTPPPGCINKTVKGYVNLSSDGCYHGIDLSDDKIGLPTPDIGSLANSKEKSNLLVEKISVVFPDAPNSKNGFFLEGLRSAAKWEPSITACVTALSTPETTEAIQRDISAHKLKPSDRISFKIDGIPIVSMPSVLDWWKVFRQQFNKVDADQERCLITGELITPVSTAPKIQGLSVVGGHASGDSLICFDKAAFTSYGLKQAANAPVSEEAIAAVKSALDKLLKGAPILAGMKFVHWYDHAITPEQDIMAKALNGDADDYDDYDDDAPDEEEQKQLRAEQMRAAERAADALVRSAELGNQPASLANTYHILLLTGVGGRVMVRRYQHGSYEELSQRLKLWWSDLSMKDRKGTGWEKHYKLSVMLIRLLKRQKNDSKVFDRLGKELSGVTPAVLTAILSGGPLPDTVAARALAYIRSEMTEADENTKSSPVPDGICCQWLKAWLLRKRRRDHLEEIDMTCYHADHPEQAYHCGALTALYGRIQSIAMPEVGVGVIQRYYASASQKPALVLGQLERLSVHHLAKFTSKGLAKIMSDRLADAYVSVGKELPKTLTLEQQAYFALGYRQMQAQLNLDREKNKDEHKNDVVEDHD